MDSKLRPPLHPAHVALLTPVAAFRRTVASLTDPARLLPITRARCAAMLVFYRDLSLRTIGVVLGGRAARIIVTRRQCAAAVQEQIRWKNAEGRRRNTTRTALRAPTQRTSAPASHTGADQRGQVHPLPC